MRRAVASLVCLLALAFPAAGEATAVVPAVATEALGVDLLREGPSGNAVYSPDSLATVLAMAGAGARGATAAQIAETLHLPSAKWIDTLGFLQGALALGQMEAAEGREDAPTLKFANGLFAQSGLPLQPGFLARLEDHFRSSVEPVDFAGDPAGALGAINSWTSEQTEGLIPQLFSELPAETRLVLADAAYLKAAWRYPFESYETRVRAFHRPSGVVEAKFMNQARELPFGSGPGYRAVELPYRASDLSMLVVSPTEGSVGGLQRRLAGNGIAAIAKGLRRRPVELSLPRFHLRVSTELVAPLKKLGMTLPFSEAADFSGMVAGEPLRIGAVEQVADLAVGEEGTVASAATGLVTVPVSAKPELPEAIKFDVNHPFLVFLRDDDTGAVLFAARVVDPSVES
jgi:serpin B